MPAGLGETPFELGHGPGRGAATGNHHEIAVGGNGVLLVAEEFAQPSLGAVALGGTTHGRSGGDHADAGRMDGGNQGQGRRVTDGPRRDGAAWFPPDGKSPAIESPALLPHGADFRLATKVLLRAKSHGPTRRA